jgi:hypothetical protein
LSVSTVGDISNLILKIKLLGTIMGGIVGEKLMGEIVGEIIYGRNNLWEK